MNGTQPLAAQNATSRNGREKPDAMIYARKEHAIPADSVYQIRHYQRGKAVYVTVGSEYDAA
jgi:hypothetical protein